MSPLHVSVPQSEFAKRGPRGPRISIQTYIRVFCTPTKIVSRARKLRDPRDPIRAIVTCYHGVRRGVFEIFSGPRGTPNQRFARDCQQFKRRAPGTPTDTRGELSAEPGSMPLPRCPTAKPPSRDPLAAATPAKPPAYGVPAPPMGAPSHETPPQGPALSSDRAPSAETSPAFSLGGVMCEYRTRTGLASRETWGSTAAPTWPRRRRRLRCVGPELAGLATLGAWRRAPSGLLHPAAPAAPVMVCHTAELLGNALANWPASAPTVRYRLATWLAYATEQRHSSVARRRHSQRHSSVAFSERGYTVSLQLFP